MVHQEEHDTPSQEAEHVLREEVGGRDRVRGVHDRGDDQESEGGRDRIPRVEPSPDRVDEVHPQKDEKHLEVGNRHSTSERRGTSKCLGRLRWVAGRGGLSDLKPPVNFT